MNIRINGCVTMTIDSKDRLSPHDFVIYRIDKIVPNEGITPRTAMWVTRYISDIPTLRWCHRCGNLWVRRGVHEPKKCPECYSEAWSYTRSSSTPGPKPKTEENK